MYKTQIVVIMEVEFIFNKRKRLPNGYNIYMCAKRNKQ